MAATVANMPRPPSDSVQIAVRVPTSWLARADILIPLLGRPGIAVTRTDVIRAAIAKGLDVFEAEAKATERQALMDAGAHAGEVLKGHFGDGRTKPTKKK